MSSEVSHPSTVVSSLGLPIPSDEDEGIEISKEEGQMQLEGSDTAVAVSPVSSDSSLEEDYDISNMSSASKEFLSGIRLITEDEEGDKGLYFGKNRVVPLDYYKMSISDAPEEVEAVEGTENNKEQEPTPQNPPTESTVRKVWNVIKYPLACLAGALMMKASYDHQESIQEMSNQTSYFMNRQHDNLKLSLFGPMDVETCPKEDPKSCYMSSKVPTWSEGFSGVDESIRSTVLGYDYQAPTNQAGEPVCVSPLNGAETYKLSPQTWSQGAENAAETFKSALNSVGKSLSLTS